MLDASGSEFSCFVAMFNVAFAIIVGVLININYGDQCVIANGTEIRDKSVLQLSGNNIFNLTGNWYVVSSYDVTQDSYWGRCSCTWYNLTVHPNYETDNLYYATCPVIDKNLTTHFKGRFIDSNPGLWYESFIYETTEQIDIIDYEMVEYMNANGENVTTQTLIRYDCLPHPDFVWVAEVWAKRNDVPKYIVQQLLSKFPSPVNTTTDFHMNNLTQCSF